MDNICHNMSSVTSKDSFHGTTIPLMQAPDADQVETCRGQMSIRTAETKLFSLPQWYSQVSPIASIPEVKVPLLHNESAAYDDNLD